MNPSVLIVEDDPELREALADTLALASIPCLQAASAEEALALLKGQGVDLVVSDVNMPGMDGHQLLQRLRQSPSCPAGGADHRLWPGGAGGGGDSQRRGGLSDETL